MIFPFSNILLTLPLLIFFLILSYLIGALFSFLVQQKKNDSNYFFDLFSIFGKLFTGIVLMSSVYAIIVTKFQTCLLPAPFLLAIFWRLKSSSTSTELVSNNQDIRLSLILCLAAVLLYWVYFSSFFISFDEKRVNYIGYDTAYYARLSSYLNFSGQEKTSFDYLHFSNNSPEPYHYGDLWITSLITRITGLHHTLIIFSVVYPALASLFVTGLASYVSGFFKQKLSAKTCLFFLLSGFVSGFAILNFLNGESILTPMIGSPKLLIVVCVFILILESLRRANWDHAIVASCLGIVVYEPIAPAIITTLVIVFLTGLLTKKIPASKIVFGLVTALFTGAYLFILYYDYFLKKSEDSSFSNNIYNLKTTINIIAGRLNGLLMILPFIILFYLLKKSTKLRNKDLFLNILNRFDLIFLLSLPAIALIYWASLYFITYDAMQFYSNILLPVASIAIILVLVKGTLTNNTILKIFSWSLFVITISYNFWHSTIRKSLSKEDFIATQQFVTKYPFSYFVNLRSISELQTVFERNTVYSQPLIFLDYITSPYVNISLNVPYIIDSSFLYSQIEKKIRATAPFSRFVVQQNKLATPEDNMYSFIRQTKIQFLTLSGRARLSSILKPLIKDSVLISETGWKIYYIGP